jgi:hypothetical protein
MAAVEATVPWRPDYNYGVGADLEGYAKLSLKK